MWYRVLIISTQISPPFIFGQIMQVVTKALKQYQQSTTIVRQFIEAQDGKGACDRTAAVINANIRRFVNEGHDLVTARDMKQVLNIY